MEHDKPRTWRRPSLHQTGAPSVGAERGWWSEEAPGSLDRARGPARGTWALAAQAGRSLKGAEGREKPRGQAVRLEGWQAEATLGLREGDRVRGAHSAPRHTGSRVEGPPAG